MRSDVVYYKDPVISICNLEGQLAVQDHSLVMFLVVGTKPAVLSMEVFRQKEKLMHVYVELGMLGRHPQ